MNSESNSGIRTEVMTDRSEPSRWWRKDSDVTSVAFTEDGASSVCYLDDVDVSALNILDLLEKYYDFAKGKFFRTSASRPESSSR